MNRPRSALHCAIVATPCYWHGTIFADLLNAGLPFYGEKPLGITPTCIRNATAAWKKNPGVVAQLGFQWGAHQARRAILQPVDSFPADRRFDLEADRRRLFLDHS